MGDILPTTATVRILREVRYGISSDLPQVGNLNITDRGRGLRAHRTDAARPGGDRLPGIWSEAVLDAAGIDRLVGQLSYRPQ